jgi:hypothetical protein
VRKLLIGAPWVTASASAVYAVSKWNELPGRMAVTFFMGRVTGWQAKGTFLSFEIALMFGCLALFTVMLSWPEKIRLREGALSDPVADRRLAVRALSAAHLAIGGLLLPISLAHVVSRNLTG